jgi:hypothetical protein
MPRPLVPDPTTNPDEALASIRTTLEEVGWQPATVSGRPCTLDEVPDEGEFLLRAVPLGAVPVELTACSSSWFSDLNAMARHLEDHGWTRVALGSNADTAGLRPATPEEIDARLRYARERAAPLVRLMFSDETRAARATGTRR